MKTDKEVWKILQDEIEGLIELGDRYDARGTESGYHWASNVDQRIAQTRKIAEMLDIDLREKSG